MLKDNSDLDGVRNIFQEFEKSVGEKFSFILRRLVIELIIE